MGKPKPCTPHPKWSCFKVPGLWGLYGLRLTGFHSKLGCRVFGQAVLQTVLGCLACFSELSSSGVSKRPGSEFASLCSTPAVIIIFLFFFVVTLIITIPLPLSSSSSSSCRHHHVCITILSPSCCHRHVRRFHQLRHRPCCRQHHKGSMLMLIHRGCN